MYVAQYLPLYHQKVIKTGWTLMYVRNFLMLYALNPNQYILIYYAWFPTICAYSLSNFLQVEPYLYEFPQLGFVMSTSIATPMHLYKTFCLVTNYHYCRNKHEHLSISLSLYQWASSANLLDIPQYLRNNLIKKRETM